MSGLVRREKKEDRGWTEERDREKLTFEQEKVVLNYMDHFIVTL